MRLNADFSHFACMTPEQYHWVASPSAGVERMMLDRIGEEVARARGRAVDPAEMRRRGVVRVQVSHFRVVEGHVQRVGGERLLHHDEELVVGVGRQADALSLADRIAMQAAVLADFSRISG